MPYSWEPAPKGIALVASHLNTYRHDPDRYWSSLVGLLHDQFIQTLDEHREDCDGADCRTCQNLACLETTLEGHNAVQPAGCACPDHRVYPYRLALGDFRPTTN